MPIDMLSMNSKEIESEFADRYVRYDDPRLVHIATGFTIQTAFFLTNGN
jgi:hypothetical protein